MVNFINKQYSASEGLSNNLINQQSPQVQRNEISDIAQQSLTEATLSNLTSAPPLCSRLDLIMWELTRRIPKAEREKINGIIGMVQKRSKTGNTKRSRSCLLMG